MKQSNCYRVFALGCLLSLISPGVSFVRAADGQQAQNAPQVTVMQVEVQPVQLTLDIVGEIKAYREVDLRSRVSGNLVNINFRPGQKVSKGDLLFEIDPGPYETALANAKAGLAQAQASLARVSQDVERYKPLLPDNAIPRQVYDQAVAQAAQEEAVVASQKAAVERAQLDLDYTHVLSPLDGRVALQQVETGALITSGQTILAKVVTLDPIVVYFSVSENNYLDYMRKLNERKKVESEAEPDIPIELLLADGSIYKEKGKIDYSDPEINRTTGTLTLRAVFPNPNELLKAGMNCRVRVYYDKLEHAILVPQKSVSENLGKYFITVIGKDNVAQMVPVDLGQRKGDSWLVLSGLQGGETIVVDGVQKALPGRTVTPVPVGAGSLNPAAKQK